MSDDDGTDRSDDDNDSLSGSSRSSGRSEESSEPSEPSPVNSESESEENDGPSRRNYRSLGSGGDDDEDDDDDDEADEDAQSESSASTSDRSSDQRSNRSGESSVERNSTDDDDNDAKPGGHKTNAAASAAAASTSSAQSPRRKDSITGKIIDRLGGGGVITRGEVGNSSTVPVTTKSDNGINATTTGTRDGRGSTSTHSSLSGGAARGAVRMPPWLQQQQQQQQQQNQPKSQQQSNIWNKAMNGIVNGTASDSNNKGTDRLKNISNHQLYHGKASTSTSTSAAAVAAVGTKDISNPNSDIPPSESHGNDASKTINEEEDDEVEGVGGPSLTPVIWSLLIFKLPDNLTKRSSEPPHCLVEYINHPPSQKLSTSSSSSLTGKGTGNTGSHANSVRDLIMSDPPSVSNTTPNQLSGYRVQITEKYHQIVYGADSKHGLCCVAVTSLPYPSSVAREMIQDLYDEFVGTIWDDVPGGGGRGGADTDANQRAVLERVCGRYQDPKNVQPKTKHMDEATVANTVDENATAAVVTTNTDQVAAVPLKKFMGMRALRQQQQQQEQGASGSDSKVTAATASAPSTWSIPKQTFLGMRALKQQEEKAQTGASVQSTSTSITASEEDMTSSPPPSAPKAKFTGMRAFKSTSTEEQSKERKADSTPSGLSAKDKFGDEKALKHSLSLHPQPPTPARTRADVADETPNIAGTSVSPALPHEVEPRTNASTKKQEATPIWLQKKAALRPVHNSPIKKVSEGFTSEDISSHHTHRTYGRLESTKSTPEQSSPGAPPSPHLVSSDKPDEGDVEIGIGLGNGNGRRSSTGAEDIATTKKQSALPEWMVKITSLRSVKREDKVGDDSNHLDVVGGGGSAAGVKNEDKQAVHKWRVQMNKKDGSTETKHQILVDDVLHSLPSTPMGGTLNSNTTKKTEEESSPSEPTSSPSENIAESEYQQPASNVSHEQLAREETVMAPEISDSAAPEWIRARSALRSTPRVQDKKTPVSPIDNALKQMTQKEEQTDPPDSDEHKALSPTPSPAPPLLPPPPPDGNPDDESSFAHEDEIVPIAIAGPIGAKKKMPVHTPEAPWRKYATSKERETTDEGFVSSPVARNANHRLSSPILEKDKNITAASSVANLSQSVPPSGLLEDIIDSQTVENRTQDEQRKLVKSDSIPLIHAEAGKLAVDGFEVFPHDDLDDSTLSRSVVDPSMDENMASNANASNQSDLWKMPARNDDDGSWVNPARPLDPIRKQKVKSEVERIFLQQLEEQRELIDSFQQVRFAGEEDAPPLHNSQMPSRKPRGGSIHALASYGIPRTIDEERGWAMPTMTATEVVYRKIETNEKDYRYTYITARSTARENAPASYWDKIRQSYFDDRDVPVLTDGAQSTSSVTSSHHLRSPTWQDPSVDVEDESWLPPSSQPGSVRHRELVLSVASGAALSHRYDDQESMTVTEKSVATSESDWQPPVGTRSRRVDFTGKVTNYVVDATRVQDDSLNSEQFSWVPNPEVVSPVEEYESENDEEDYEPIALDRATSLDPPDVEGLWADDTGDNSVASSGSSEDTSFYTESVSNDSNEDTALDDENVGDENIHGIPESFDQPESRNASVATVFRNQSVGHDEVSALPSIMRTRSMSQSSTSSSPRFEPSRTGRISFSMEPELITFQDDPNEDRGSHYGGRYKQRPSSKSQPKAKSEEREGVGVCSEKCGNYTLIGIMVLVPAVVLTVMFLVFLKPDEENDSGSG